MLKRQSSLFHEEFYLYKLSKNVVVVPAVDVADVNFAADVDAAVVTYLKLFN